MDMDDVREGKVKAEGFFRKAVVWWKFFWSAEKALEVKVVELRAEIKEEQNIVVITGEDMKSK